MSIGFLPQRQYKMNPDVVKVFNTPEAVNTAHRAIIHAIPGEIK
jgi:hypothetical protein